VLVAAVQVARKAIEKGGDERRDALRKGLSLM